MTTAPFCRLAANALGSVLAAAALLTSTQAAASAPAVEAPPQHFELVAQTPGATVWAERCAPALRTRGASMARTAGASKALPQPDPDDLSALVAALRSGDFEASGVRIVETGDGPMLELAARRPGTARTYFTICNARIRTSYE